MRKVAFDTVKDTGNHFSIACVNIFTIQTDYDLIVFSLLDKLQKKKKKKKQPIGYAS